MKFYNMNLKEVFKVLSSNEFRLNNKEVENRLLKNIITKYFKD